MPHCCRQFHVTKSPNGPLDALQENPDRTWELGARSEAIAAQLCAVLVAAVRAKYPPHEEVVSADDEIDVLPGQGVWLAKRGEGLGALSADKKRYFVLVYSQRSRALRMAYYADLQGRQPLDRKGAIPVSLLSSISARGVELRIVSGAPIVISYPRHPTPNPL